VVQQCAGLPERGHAERYGCNEACRLGAPPARPVSSVAGESLIVPGEYTV
jgi:hypothetical protein